MLKLLLLEIIEKDSAREMIEAWTRTVLNTARSDTDELMICTIFLLLVIVLSMILGLIARV